MFPLFRIDLPVGAAPQARLIDRRIPNLAARQAVLEDCNSCAWYSLYSGAADPVVLEKRQIVQRLIQGRLSMLHTLAYVLADTGRIAEAREVFGRYLGRTAGASTDPAAWLAYGILAQHFGLLDTAVFAFRKVPPPKA